MKIWVYKIIYIYIDKYKKEKKILKMCLILVKYNTKKYKLLEEYQHHDKNM